MLLLCGCVVNVDAMCDALHIRAQHTINICVIWNIVAVVVASVEDSFCIFRHFSFHHDVLWREHTKFHHSLSRQTNEHALSAILLTFQIIRLFFNTTYWITHSCGWTTGGVLYVVLCSQSLTQERMLCMVSSRDLYCMRGKRRLIFIDIKPKNPHTHTHTNTMHTPHMVLV